ncbi:MAG: sigma-70 family RNA polymerase sigma factor [Acidobacteria bacterium]|nr:MAG: sigma-70 family RNA polymerase sigma factor [Acidobacteriota bacterium]REJ98188.1 MAG: sigma-70 family RNA polymerase sigma factor [Acidobacteriota bacterium]REK16932.1 MAG: sigma-70 family RNA polymerase sigma factor [Acidobacteriota bacterium]REK42842.1 MAG: sigma-70 family RNA polymerase sigma factor [Acidobacteriota bacterium]
MPIRPLTKRKKTGELYTRRPDVQEQLDGLDGRDFEELVPRLSIPKNGGPEHLFDETLVFLLREARRANDSEKCDLIYSHLSVRVERLVMKEARLTNLQNITDFRQSVHVRVLKKLLDISSDRGDFAEAMFGSFIAREAATERRKRWRVEHREQYDVEIDAPNEHGYDLDPVSFSTTPEQEAMILNALEKLPENYATAAVMRFRDEFQIDSKDPDEPTIAKHFGVSGRTINNWLRKAVEILTEDDGVDDE